MHERDSHKDVGIIRSTNTRVPSRRKKFKKSCLCGVKYFSKAGVFELINTYILRIYINVYINIQKYFKVQTHFQSSSQSYLVNL
jgi:hypothetical protein